MSRKGSRGQSAVPCTLIEEYRFVNIIKMRSNSALRAVQLNVEEP